MPRAIRAVGAHVLLLSRLSPDPNPIEQAFAKIKLRVRKAAAWLREALGRTVDEVFDDIDHKNVRTTSGMSDIAPTRPNTH